MKRFLVLISSAALIATGCTSGAAPGAGDVIKQTEPAEQLKEQIDERNSELEGQP